MSIHEYELLQSLGGGPLTEVVAARRTRDGWPVALKRLRPEWAEDPAAVQLIRREARAGLAVVHPHLVRTLDAHVAAAPHFLVLELLTGEPLRTRLRREFALGVRPTVRFARQIAEALSAVHAAGFVHADLKPDNVYLSDPATAVLIDLGFAHKPGESSDLVRQGYRLGTVDYLAPEVAAGAAPSVAADWFGFGLTLFEMVRGHLPYPGGDVDAVLRHHATTDISRVPLMFELPARFAGLLGELLAFTADRRPPGWYVIEELVALEIATLARKRRVA